MLIANKKIDSLVTKHNEETNATLEIKYKCSGESFLTEPGQLSDLLTTSIKEIAGVNCKLSTGGGTSDARFVGILPSCRIWFSWRYYAPN